VRELMAKDVEGTLAALAGIGYREVELAGLHGRTAAEFRAILDRNGLATPSSHIPIERLRDDLPRVLDEAATLGNRYIVAPWLAEGERTADGFKRVAETLNVAGEKAGAAGMRIGYHNHDFEFAPLGGTHCEEILLSETDPAKVWFELDLFWATKAGAKPLELFERWPGRFPLVHVKDMDAAGNMVDVGAGTIDFARIHQERARAGIEHWIVEHDNPADPIASARASFASLRRIVA
jgi:sugar phosphate isomerase/epimerase